jgi:4-carboxymuconolactone decarboxylase
LPRLPEINERNPENQDTYDYLQKTRGAVRGGFAVMLASPDIDQRIAHVGTYVRFESPLPANMRELAALTASAELENPYEYVAHAHECRKLGVSEVVVKAVLDRTSATGASGDEMLSIDFTRELTRSHKLSDATFEAAHKRLGDRGVIDLIAAIGYYAMLAVCHVALEVRPTQLS